MQEPECAVGSKPLADKLFIPLVVWFFATIAATLLSLYLCQRKFRRADYSDENDDGSGANDLRNDMKNQISDGQLHASWQVSYKELRWGPRIGAGNVGEVFLGTYRGRQVAIKKLLSSWLLDASMVARFREEISLMAQMNHPSVVQFVGAVIDKAAGELCLVTEYCARGTLAEVLRSSLPLPWRTRVRMAWEIARGMDYLHRQANIIQRDLKTSNILVDEFLSIRIADFGLSRSVASVMETYCGTPATMAPEIIQQSTYDQRADIYSFGIILWELLTREEPYEGMDGLHMAYSAMKYGVRPPVPVYAPREWVALMTQCWQHESSHRPSFDDCQRALYSMLVLLDEADELQWKGVENSDSAPHPFAYQDSDSEEIDDGEEDGDDDDDVYSTSGELTSWTEPKEIDRLLTEDSLRYPRRDTQVKRDSITLSNMPPRRISWNSDSKPVICDCGDCA